MQIQQTMFDKAIIESLLLLKSKSYAHQMSYSLKIISSLYGMISGFNREAGENCALLGYYAGSNDNFKIPFTNKCALLLKHIKCWNVQLKYLFVGSYRFRSNWTIHRERMLSLVKATILWSAKVHRYMIWGVVVTSISGCGVCTACRVVCSRSKKKLNFFPCRRRHHLHHLHHL